MKKRWYDAVWNPVSGCLEGCGYCHSRSVAEHLSSRKNCVITTMRGDPYIPGRDDNFRILGEKRLIVELEKPVYFHNTVTGERRAAPFPYKFYPTYHKYRLGDIKRISGYKDIFVCSTSDLFGEGIPKQWGKDILDVCLTSPQHRYMLITKHPKNTESFAKELANKCFLIGASVTSSEDILQAKMLADTLPDTKLFLSLKPLLGPVDIPTELFERFRWVVIGADSSNKKGKVIPRREWIENILEQCEKHNALVYMEDNLKPIMGDKRFEQKTPSR